jgi:hypothetical protein
MSEYIVGYDQIVGDSYDDDLLAAVSGDRAPRTVKASQLPQSFVGVPLTSITNGTSATIQVPVQRNIRPDRFVIDRVQAAKLMVYDIKVGTVSLNASVNPVPGDMFAPDAVGTSIRALEVATPSVGLSVTLYNGDTAAMSPKAGFIGPSMKA